MTYSVLHRQISSIDQNFSELNQGPDVVALYCRDPSWSGVISPESIVDVLEDAPSHAT